MAFLTSCLCCSLLTASLTIAIMSAFLYGLAFALELYMLVDTSTSLSVPAYILTIGYLLMSILSLALIVSLRSDQTGSSNQNDKNILSSPMIK